MTWLSRRKRTALALALAEQHETEARNEAWAANVAARWRD